MSTLVIKDLSLIKNSVAKTGGKCQYAWGSWEEIAGWADVKKKVVHLKYGNKVKLLLNKGWEPHLLSKLHGHNKAEGFILWKKCT